VKYKFKKGDRAIFFHNFLIGRPVVDKLLSSYNGRALTIIKRKKDLYRCQFDDDKMIVPILESSLRKGRHPLTTIFECKLMLDNK